VNRCRGHQLLSWFLIKIETYRTNLQLPEHFEAHTPLPLWETGFGKLSLLRPVNGFRFQFPLDELQNRDVIRVGVVDVGRLE